MYLYTDDGKTNDGRKKLKRVRRILRKIRIRYGTNREHRYHINQMYFLFIMMILISTNKNLVTKEAVKTIAVLLWRVIQGNHKFHIFFLTLTSVNNIPTT